MTRKLRPTAQMKKYYILIETINFSTKLTLQMRTIHSFFILATSISVIHHMTRCTQEQYFESAVLSYKKKCPR